MPKANTSVSDSINRIIVDADHAMDALASARREAVAEYCERIRKLRDLKRSLHMARAGEVGELFDLAPLISPELARLLQDPVHDL